MSDLTIATRNLFARTFGNMVALKIPMLAMLMEHRRVNSKGGAQIVYDLIKDDAEDETQWYKAGDPLTVGQASFLDQAKFNYKYGQTPMRLTVDEEIKNELATSEVKRRDLAKIIVKRAQDGMKRKINSRIHNASTADTAAGFQSVPFALEHSRTYGELTTTTSVKTWWNGASLGTTWSDRNTSMVLSLSNIRLMKAVVRRYNDEGKLYLFLPEALYSKLQGLAEGKTHYEASNEKNSRLFKYGTFESFHIYNIEVVQDTWMTLNSQTTYALLVNSNTFEFRLHPRRAFMMTKFFQQDQVAGGADEKVARVKVAGNLCCEQPNANMWKSAVT